MVSANISTGMSSVDENHFTGRANSVSQSGAPPKSLTPAQNSATECTGGNLPLSLREEKDTFIALLNQLHAGSSALTRLSSSPASKEKFEVYRRTLAEAITRTQDLISEFKLGDTNPKS